MDAVVKLMDNAHSAVTNVCALLHRAAPPRSLLPGAAWMPCAVLGQCAPLAPASPRACATHLGR
jgi:hypothetical protein